MPDTPVQSSNLHSVGYDRTTRTLTVRFKSGSEYSYAGVHPNTYHGMMRAPSKGRYFHKRVRGRFVFEKKAARIDKVSRSTATPKERIRAVALAAYYGAVPSPLYEQTNHHPGTSYLAHMGINAAYARRWIRGEETEGDLAFERTVNARVYHPLNRAKTASRSALALGGLGLAAGGAGLHLGAVVNMRAARNAATRYSQNRKEYNKLLALQPTDRLISHRSLQAIAVQKGHKGKLYGINDEAASYRPMEVFPDEVPEGHTPESHLADRMKHVRTGDNPHASLRMGKPDTMNTKDGPHYRYATALHELGHAVDAVRADLPVGEFYKTNRGRPHKGLRQFLPNKTWGVKHDTRVQAEIRANHYAEQIAKEHGVPLNDHEMAYNRRGNVDYIEGHLVDMYYNRSKLMRKAGFGASLAGVGLLARSMTKRAAKTAALTTTLEPHQARVRERMKRQNGLVVAHDMGSGKTLSSIAVLHDHHQAHPEQTSLVLPPASLLANYTKELQKHTGGSVKPSQMMSQQKMTLTGAGEARHGLLVVDEAHRARNIGSKLKETLKGIQADKRLVMTGTPVYNHPSDIGPLVNLAAGHHVLPESPGDFERKFVEQTHVWPKGLKGLMYRAKGGTPGVKQTLKRDPALMSALGEYVDYHKPAGQGAHFPSVTHHEHRVPLSGAQQERYDYMLGKLPPKLRAKIQMDLPPNKTEAMKLVAFLGGPRQIANSVHGFSEGTSALDAAHDSPKIQAIVDRIKANPKERHLVYSNYIDSAVTPISAALSHAGIGHGKYTGQESKRDREGAVKGFNEGHHKVLVVSSAGGEGLDLKGVRHVHITEPHWNEQKLNQVMARANRFKSHAHLPKAERTVQMHRYISQVPDKGVRNQIRGVFGRDKKMHDTAESYIQHRAAEKETLNDQMHAFMAEQTQKTIRDMHSEIKAGPKKQVLKSFHEDMHTVPQA